MDEMTSAFAKLAAVMVEAGEAMSRLCAAWVAAEREEFESHPDVQEVVARMRGFYGD